MNFQWLLSWLLHKSKGGYLLPTWAWKIACRRFNWMLQVSLGQKWWRRPCTFRWYPQRSASTRIEDWKSLVAGLLWWGGRREEQSSLPLTSNDMFPQLYMAINSSVCSHLFTFSLMTTGAFSRNVSKLFSELKLVTDNLFKVGMV